jgi:hypothetical protein
VENDYEPPNELKEPMEKHYYTYHTAMNSLSSITGDVPASGTLPDIIYTDPSN